MNSRRLFLFRSLCLSLAAFGSFALPGGMGAGVKSAHAATGGEGAAQGACVRLPEPDKQGGMPLMRALAERKSMRRFKADDLSDQQLGDLLWAAWGVNRSDGRRTAPTARNDQQVAVYAAMANGVWRYEGKGHELVKELDRDTRKDFGGAPLTLVYAAEQGPFAGMHLGSMYQNAALYCASAGLANVVKATGVKVLEKDLKLPGGYSILIIQSVGLPG